MAKIQNTVQMMTVFIAMSSVILFLLMMQVGWGLTISMAVALVFAAITAILATGTQYIQHQRHLAAFEQKRKVADNTDTHQSRTVEIDMPFEQAFNSALDALQLLDGDTIPKPLMFFLE